MRDGSETLYEASDRRCAEESGKKSLGSRGNFAAEINYSVTVKLQNRDLSCWGPLIIFRPTDDCNDYLLE